MKTPKIGIEQLCKFELALAEFCDKWGFELEDIGHVALTRIVGRDASGLFVRYGCILREK